MPYENVTTVASKSDFGTKYCFPRQQTLFGERETVMGENSPVSGTVYSGLSPIIKWPGGKEKELKYIIPNIPKFQRYFEPFVGGGAVFMGIEAREYYINDFSKELMCLYNSIASSDKQFFHFVDLMDVSWKNAVAFFEKNGALTEMYLQYRKGILSSPDLKNTVHSFCVERKSDIRNISSIRNNESSDVLVKEMETNIFRKMTRMRKLELEKHLLPDEDLTDNIETAIKSAVYMYYRHLYNDRVLAQENPILHCALFFFMRNYAYSGMFRYSSKGDFNVPYGGIAYNSKLLSKKTAYYKSAPVLRHFSDAKLYNLDFEEFLKTVGPSSEDFVFLDPPYDSEFSTYAQHDFTKEDQSRLAKYLINECRAKWMLVIKNTDFIFSLYNQPGINIRSFDKEYVVSFMNRNEKKVTHLLITNY